MRKAPQQLRSRFTVDAILEAASRVFGAHTYESATTIRVAETAGVSVGSLYQYFPNKDSIVNALTARIVDHHLSRIERKVAELGPLPPTQAVNELVRVICELYFRNKKSMKVLFERTERRNLTPVILHARQRAITMIATLFGQTPATLLVHGILGILEAHTVAPFPGLSDAELEQQISLLARRYLGV
jgi:AcrR family transcriptional regulator